MSGFQNCLPEFARPHYIRLRNQKSDDARSKHQTKLSNLRGDAAARGIIRSGHQELAEWRLTEEFFDEMAYAWFEAAVETCELYEIRLDQRITKCIEDSVREFLTAQYQNVQRQSAQSPNGHRIPLSARLELAGRIQGCRFPIFNTIQIDLEKARIESLKKVKESETKSKVTLSNNGKQKMLRTASVLNILIASPSDVNEERTVVERVIHSWNATHFSRTEIILNPIKWESHAYPASGDRPQAIINKQIVQSGDILIAIFGYKLGTPTGVAQSGTIEEIEEFRSAGKYVALYFSTADIPRSADRAQLEALEAYKKERQKDTLYFEFTDASDLNDHLTKHLPKIIYEVCEKLDISSLPQGRRPDLPEQLKDINDQHAPIHNSPLLADIISELEDNLDCASRPRTADVYRRPSTKVWLDNRNRISLPQDLHLEVKNTYNRIGSWADIVASGLNPNLGSMELNLIVSDLKSSSPSLIHQLRKLQQAEKT